MGGTWLGFLTVVAAGVPSAIAAYYGHANRVQLRTGNNKTVGEMVTEVHGKESEQATVFDTHYPEDTK